MKDTICAVATPVGSGGVGVIRISGAGAAVIAGQVFKAAKGIAVRDFEPRKMYYGEVVLPAFSDVCLCVYFKAPESFTGEDVCEIQCHGGAVLLNAVMNELIKKGARTAECGEFTKRAFINGKLDLSESEGLIDIINAESEAAIAAASALHRGGLSKRVNKMQDLIRELSAHIEVTIDYSEEDIEAATTQQARETLVQIRAQLQNLSDTYSQGMVVKDGVTVGIVGLANAGKSSLLNALLGYDRAIVTDIAGTTRDTVDGEYHYKGIKFRIADTAGIRESEDKIEAEGIRRAMQYIESCDGVIYLRDTAEKDEQSERRILLLIEGKRAIHVISKSDLLPQETAGQMQDMAATGQTLTTGQVAAKQAGVEQAAIKQAGAEQAATKHILTEHAGAEKVAGATERQIGGELYISSVTGQNIDELKDRLYNLLARDVHQGGFMLTNRRHYDTVLRAIAVIDETLADIEGMYIDMIAFNIRALYECLGEITGETGVERIMDEIFSRFCLGK